MLQALKDHITGKVPLGKKRSDKWPKARAEWLATNPTCAVCGGKTKTEVHHVQPFHLKPELELDRSNFITLCEDKKNGVNCHLLFGHLGNFKSVNTNVRADVQAWYSKIANRPVGGAA